MHCETVPSKSLIVKCFRFLSHANMVECPEASKLLPTFNAYKKLNAGIQDERKIQYAKFLSKLSNSTDVNLIPSLQ